jgi:hypothetical protein
MDFTCSGVISRGMTCCGFDWAGAFQVFRPPVDVERASTRIGLRVASCDKVTGKQIMEFA